MQIDVERVRAVVYGQAIGDALGLPVEFRSAKAIAELRKSWTKGSDWPNSYRPTTRDAGIAWKAGEWSDDTEQALCILDAYLQGTNEGRPASDPIDLLIVANEFVKWAQTNGRGMGNHTWNCLKDYLFLVDPKVVAAEVWEQSGRQSAPNGAVMRTAYVGILRPWDIAWTAQEAAEVAATTHADPRCIASAVAVSVAIASFINGSTLQEAIKAATTHASKHDPDVGDWLWKELPELNLDEGLSGPKGSTKPPIGFTYKALGAGFAALRMCAQLRTTGLAARERFRQSLEAIILAGGDTDTNGAIAGALLAAYEGMGCLPEPLVKGLVPRNMLDQRISQLLILYSLQS